MKMISMLGVAAMAGFVVTAGCRKAEPPDGKAGLGERSGAAVDNAAAKTADAARSVATKTKEVTGKALVKTGEAMENAGEAMERTGEGMQAPMEPDVAE